MRIGCFFVDGKPFVRRAAPCRAASGSILNKTLLQVSLMVLYNALIPWRVDDCIRVLVLHEQAAQSASVPDIDLRRKKKKRKKIIHGGGHPYFNPASCVILNPDI